MTTTEINVRELAEELVRTAKKGKTNVDEEVMSTDVFLDLLKEFEKLAIAAGVRLEEWVYYKAFSRPGMEITADLLSCRSTVVREIARTLAGHRPSANPVSTWHQRWCD